MRPCARAGIARRSDPRRDGRSGCPRRPLTSLELPGAVLIACSDQWALAVSGLPAEVRERFPSSISPHASIERFVDKDRFRELVDEPRHPPPAHDPAASWRGRRGAVGRRAGRRLPQADRVLAHNRHFRTKGFFIESRDHARGLLEEAAQNGVSFMLQEYIPGGPGRRRSSSTVRRPAWRHPHHDRLPPGAAIRPGSSNTCCDVNIPLVEVEACLPAATRSSMPPATGASSPSNSARRARRSVQHHRAQRAAVLADRSRRARRQLTWPGSAIPDAQELELPDPLPYKVGRYGMYEMLDAMARSRAVASRRRPDGPVLEALPSATRRSSGADPDAGHRRESGTAFADESAEG